jgi:hypothetical protein
VSTTIRARCKKKLPNLEKLLEKLAPHVREICRGDDWSTLTVGAARVNVKGRVVELSGPSGGDWANIIAFAEMLADACDGDVIDEDGRVLHAHAARADKQLGTLDKALRARKRAAMRKALLALNRKGDVDLMARACDLALAAATHDDALLDELVALLAYDEIGAIEEATFDGSTFADVVALRVAAGGARTDACRKYARRVKETMARQWASDHPVEGHADDIVARLDAGDEDAPTILAHWRGVPDEPRVKEVIRAAIAKRSSPSTPLSPILRKHASSLPWSDDALRSLHEDDRTYLVQARRAADEAAERSRKLMDEIKRRNAEQFARI